MMRRAITFTRVFIAHPSIHREALLLDRPLPEVEVEPLIDRCADLGSGGRLKCNGERIIRHLVVVRAGKAEAQH